ncbi:MAG: HAMP domain-containing protein [Treponema sp.]|nr:HAMP domain-containing protein [Treponema sp.]
MARPILRFTIGAKLITIITIIVIISLGSIIALVSWLVTEDLRIAAEESNFEANRYSASEAENLLLSLRLNGTMLIQTLHGGELRTEAAQGTLNFFFSQNPGLAVLAFESARALPGPSAQDLIINEAFFYSQDLSLSLADSYLEENRSALQRAAQGETVLLNASPHFGLPLLAYFFPSQDLHGQNIGALLLCSPISLSGNFGYGTNRSFLINDRGEVLVHPEGELMLLAPNMAGDSFIRSVWENPGRSAQRLYTGDDGIRYFGAFTKLSQGGAVITTIEFDKVFEGIRATTRRNLYLTAAVLSISILFIWFFAKSISVPLRILASAAQSIEGGDFGVRLDPRGRDEIGALTSSFQRMSAALGIFGRFTNRDIAVRAMRGEIKPGGLPKDATIFFSDIRDFTALSEQFTASFPEDASNRIVTWLNNYLGHMVNCVEETGGVVDKFIGDSVMAHWGTAYASASPAADAYNCVTAALLMRRALMAMNAQRRPDDPADPPIRIGCGINTGRITAGQIGSDLRMEYTVVGDPVNLASRVEALCKPLAVDILISENTWALVRDKFLFAEMPSVSVKGKEDPLRIFAVINHASSREGPQSLDELRQLLGTTAPDLSLIDINGEERKYKLGKD